MLEELPWEATGRSEQWRMVYALSLRALAFVGPKRAVRAFCRHWSRFGDLETVPALASICLAVEHSSADDELSQVAQTLWARQLQTALQQPSAHRAGILSGLVELLGYCRVRLDGDGGPLAAIEADANLAASVLFLWRFGRPTS